MDIRFLEPNEYHLLEEIFKEYQGDLPSPNLSKIAIAEDENGIAGFFVLQLIPHCEPMWIRPDKQGSMLWFNLFCTLLPLMKEKGAICLEGNEVSAKIALSMGMIPSTCFIMTPQKAREIVESTLKEFMQVEEVGRIGKEV